MPVKEHENWLTFGGGITISLVPNFGVFLFWNTLQMFRGII